MSVASDLCGRYVEWTDDKTGRGYYGHVVVVTYVNGSGFLLLVWSGQHGMLTVNAERVRLS